jgi:hypothetical protein
MGQRERKEAEERGRELAYKKEIREEQALCNYTNKHTA